MFPLTIPMPPKGFNLLMLDEGEVCLRQYRTIYHPPNPTRENVGGYAILCSKSLFFVPSEDLILDAAPGEAHTSNHLHTILRFPFQQLNGAKTISEETKDGIFQLYALLQCVEYTRLDPIGASEAVHVQERTDHKLEIVDIPMSEFSQTLQEVVTLALEGDSGEEGLHYVIAKFEEEATQTMKVLESDLGLLFETSVSHMLPLVQSRGRLTVSGACVRFKPFYCPNGGRQAGESIPLCSIIRIAKRLHLFQDVGIEIFLEDSPSALFVCENQNHRDIIYKILLDQPGAFALLVNQPELNTMENLSLDAITERWRMGGISTFDYLMYLNFFCGRTFNDVAQYPVFPWVLQDYTSEQLDLSDPSVFRDLAKPVGALNTARLKQFMTRYAEMPPKERFMYGTHYSSPSYVTFYLLREAPEYALRLQDGKFDAPDRLFHSIAESWQSALDNPTDVKELIPEFFDPSNEGKFLRNLQGLHFGDKQCGETVGDVILPPWAKG